MESPHDLLQKLPTKPSALLDSPPLLPSQSTSSPLLPALNANGKTAEGITAESLYTDKSQIPRYVTPLTSPLSRATVRSFRFSSKHGYLPDSSEQKKIIITSPLDPQADLSFVR